MRRLLALVLVSFLLAPIDGTWAQPGSVNIRSIFDTDQTPVAVGDAATNAVRVNVVSQGAALGPPAPGAPAGSQTGPMVQGVVGVPIYQPGTIQPLTLTPLGALRGDVSGSSIILGGLTASGQNATAPPTELLVGGQFNTTPTTLSSGNVSPLQLDSAANLLVNLKTALPTGANTIGAVTQGTSPWVENLNQVGGTAVVTGGVAGLLAAAGNAASAATDSGNPLKVGGVIGISLPTAGTDTQRMNEMVDKFGRPVITHNADRGLLQVCSSITLTTTTETTLCSAGAAGVFLDLEHLSCSNTSATLVRADIRDATGGTVRKSMALGASGGGFEMNLDALWPQTTAANNWTVQLSGAVTDVRCQAVAVKNK